MLPNAVDCVKQVNTNILINRGILSICVDGIKRKLTAIEEVGVLVELAKEEMQECIN